MNIAYLINQYPQPSHTFIRREIAALEAAGVRVDRFTIRRWNGELQAPGDRAERERTRAVLEGGKFASALRLSGSAFYALLRTPVKFVKSVGQALSLGTNSDRGRIVHLIYLAEACVLVRWMRARQIDHVHAHFGTNSTTVALLLHALGGPTFSFTVHGPEEFEKPQELKLREKVEAASFVVVISEFGRSLLQKSCDQRNWKKIEVVRCGLDSEFLSSTQSANRNGGAHVGNRLICVGRLSPQKAHSVLLESAGILAKQGTDFELVLVGDGPLRSEIEEQIRELNLGEFVKLRGWLGSAAVREEILAARALVLSSWAEGLPVVLMEAMALGKAVVATRVAGVPELVTDKVHGRLVTAGDVAGLAEAMREVLQLSDEQLENIAEAAVTQVSLLHNVTTEAAKLAVHFSDVQRSKTGGA